MDEPGYDAEEVAAVFGRAAATYDSVIPFFSRFGSRLVGLADLRPGERVLDVGSGRGATLFPAAAAVTPGGEVLGIDLSEEMVARLQADIGPGGATNVSVRRMDVEALDVADGTFDAVIASFVLHLVPEPAAAAAGLFRALRPGGRCLAAVPAGSGPEWEFLVPLIASFAPRALRPPAVPFRADFDLPALLARAGFEVTTTDHEEAEFFFADEQAWWAWGWSNGLRAVFETLAPSDLDELRRKAFTEMTAHRTAEGLAMHQRARFVVAHKPLGY